MDLTVNEYIDGLLSDEAHQRPSDHRKVEDLEQKMQLPPWFDDEKFNQGRRFFWDFSFPFILNMILGVVALFAVPSILKILVSTRRSNSTYTAYKRYLSTLMHVFAWHEHELKPGTKSWRSLQTVRTRHFRAGLAASMKGLGTVSQRDLALTQFGFIGFMVLNPDNFSVRQMKNGDWESYNHFWRTIGYMIGMEDRYNLCRKNIDETREAVRILLDRVFTPCLENAPEYYEHTARVTLQGLGVLFDQMDPVSIIYRTKCYANVPGYVYTEAGRVAFQNRLKEHLNGKSDDIGVDAVDFIPNSAINGLPKRSARLFYVRDFDTIETTPAYKQLNFKERYSLALLNIILTIYNTDVGRYILNLLYRWKKIVSFNFPYKAFMRFGYKNGFVDMFVEDPKDDTQPKPNSEYQKPPPPDTWYSKLFTILW